MIFQGGPDPLSPPPSGSALETVSSQLVPKSTRTLVNSYPVLVNSYLTFGQLVPTPSQLVPESKNVAGLSMIDGEWVSLGPNKPFQTLKHHNLLSVLRLSSGQPVQRSQLVCLWGGVLRACSIIHNHLNLVFAIGLELVQSYIIISI